MDLKLETVATLTACGVVSYLVGAIPFGLLVARVKGIDIRQVGSRNIGATNVFRCVGKGWGILTLLCDALKGFLPTFGLPILARRWAPDLSAEAIGITCLCLSVAGHNWPVYLGFKGGKGVATSAGALAGVAPLAVGIGVLTWILVVTLTRYVSLASIVAALTIAVSGWFLYAQTGRWLVAGTLLLLAAVAVWRHKANLVRLRQGTENKITFGKPRDNNRPTA